MSNFSLMHSSGWYERFHYNDGIIQKSDSTRYRPDKFPGKIVAQGSTKEMGESLYLHTSGGDVIIYFRTVYYVIILGIRHSLPSCSACQAHCL